MFICLQAKFNTAARTAEVVKQEQKLLMEQMQIELEKNNNLQGVQQQEIAIETFTEARTDKTPQSKSR